MKYRQLTRKQRYVIYLGLKEGKSQKAITRQINVHPLTVGREIKRDPTRPGRYGRRMAQESEDIRKERILRNRGVDPMSSKEALSLLREGNWFPRKISGFLSLRFKHMSHETIYKRIRDGKVADCGRHCRHKMKYGHHVRVAKKTKVRNIPNRTGIHDRPSKAYGKRSGNWEMDLVIGKG